MQYLTHFVHAFLMFVAPLKFLNYKSTIKQRALFTLIYGLAIIFSRRIYDFLPLTFGTHTILLVIISSVLFKNIVKEISWLKSVYTALILFISVLINDALILLPSMKLFDLTVQKIENSSFLILFSIIIPNATLIIMYIVGHFKNKKDKQISLNS